MNLFLDYQKKIYQELKKLNKKKIINFPTQFKEIKPKAFEKQDWVSFSTHIPI